MIGVVCSVESSDDMKRPHEQESAGDIVPRRLVRHECRGLKRLSKQPAERRNWAFCVLSARRVGMERGQGATKCPRRCDIDRHFSPGDATSPVSSSEPAAELRDGDSVVPKPFNAKRLTLNGLAKTPSDDCRRCSKRRPVDGRVSLSRSFRRTPRGSSRSDP